MLYDLKEQSIFKNRSNKKLDTLYKILDSRYAAYRGTNLAIEYLGEFAKEFKNYNRGSKIV
jgi:hypothetical protein